MVLWKWYRTGEIMLCLVRVERAPFLWGLDAKSPLADFYFHLAGSRPCTTVRRANPLGREVAVARLKIDELRLSRVKRCACWPYFRAGVWPPSPGQVARTAIALGKSLSFFRFGCPFGVAGSSIAPEAPSIN